jgi:uncharacterized protein YktB (UPF0637 family)
MSKLFTKEDFGVFEVDGLDERMELIRERIQPVFQELGDTYTEYINEKTGYDLSFHIAQHRRRTTNPPESTWCAFGGNNRGYKKFPHVQVGINTEHIFIWASIIDNPKHEHEMGQNLIDYPENWKNLPEDYIVSKDHTIREVMPLTEASAEQTLERLLKVKKGEILIGRIIPIDSNLLEDTEKQKAFIKETIDTILPVYKQMLDTYFEKEEA